MGGVASRNPLKAGFRRLASLDFTVSFAVINKARGKDGKFISVPSINLEPLDPTLKEALIGELLGDGCLRYTRKVEHGKPNTN